MVNVLVTDERTPNYGDSHPRYRSVGDRRSGVDCHVGEQRMSDRVVIASGPLVRVENQTLSTRPELCWFSVPGSVGGHLDLSEGRVFGRVAVRGSTVPSPCEEGLLVDGTITRCIHQAGGRKLLFTHAPLTSSTPGCLATDYRAGQIARQSRKKSALLLYSWLVRAVALIASTSRTEIVISSPPFQWVGG